LAAKDDRAGGVDTVHLKHPLRGILSDRANLGHGRPPRCGRCDTTAVRHFDAGEQRPSTSSLRAKRSNPVPTRGQAPRRSNRERTIAERPGIAWRRAQITHRKRSVDQIGNCSDTASTPVARASSRPRSRLSVARKRAASVAFLGLGRCGPKTWMPGSSPGKACSKLHTG
jgi:hypothetical protein